jgi:hypothetical protein
MLLWNELLVNNALAIEEYLQHSQLMLMSFCIMAWHGMACAMGHINDFVELLMAFPSADHLPVITRPP